MGVKSEHALPENLAKEGEEENLRLGSVDLLVMQILQGVYEGRYVPGQKLIEGDLTRTYGLGRGTVREALRRLEVEGLVDKDLHRGARIRFFGRDEVRDILEINEHLMAMAVIWAAQRHGSSHDLDKLHAIIAAMSHRIDEGDMFGLSRLRFDYMRELVKLGKNKEMTHYLPRYDATIIRTQFRAVFNRATASEDLDAYREIARLILARDAEGAARVARKYVRSWSVNVQRLPDHYFAH